MSPVANPPPSGGVAKKGGMEGLQNYVRVFVWFGRCEDCESVVMLFGRQFQELLLVVCSVLCRFTCSCRRFVCCFCMGLFRFLCHCSRIYLLGSFRVAGGRFLLRELEGHCSQSWMRPGVVSWMDPTPGFIWRLICPS
jgi:hypothetical protein